MVLVLSFSSIHVAITMEFKGVAPDDTAKGAAHLPQSYTIVPLVILGKNDPPIPKLEGSYKSDCQLIPEALQKEHRYV
jgi:hypothetical protein